MATSTLSVSIPLELCNFLEENTDLSPSKIIQSRLYEIKNDLDRSSNKLKVFENRNIALSTKLNNVLRWVEEQNLVIPDNVLE